MRNAPFRPFRLIRVGLLLFTSTLALACSEIQEAIIEYIRGGPSEVSLLPQEVEVLSIDAEIQRAKLDGQTLYLSTRERGLVLIDAQDPTKLQVLGECATSSNALDLIKLGSRVYVADELSGLRVVDVSNRSQPRELGAIDTPAKAAALALHGSDRLYLADTNSLRIVDISAPSAPREVGSLELFAVDVEVNGARLYVADAREGLRIFDLASPDAPTPLGHYRIVDGANTLAIGDGVAYVASGTELRVIDISNPAAPSELAIHRSIHAYDEGHRPPVITELVLVGSQLYVARATNGPWVYQVANRAELNELFGSGVNDFRGASTNTIAPDPARSVFFAGNTYHVVVYSLP